MTAAGGPRLSRTARVALRGLPALIAVLWITGVARFRAMDLDAVDYLALLAAAFALLVVVGRARRRSPPPALPEGVRVTAVVSLAAAVTGAAAMVLGGVLELLVPDPDQVVTTPWWLRTVWHGACGFAASYCRLLLRYAPAAERPRV